MSRVLFITGTDTGVGKTLLTAALLHHCLEAGISARAMKPFCSGGREDALLLRELQGGGVALDEMNPFYFAAPAAPFIAACKEGKTVEMGDVLPRIQQQRDRCDLLLVEGAGGLLVPLGRDFLVKDLIHELDCGVVIVGGNRLGVINHALLTHHALTGIRRRSAGVVLMEQPSPDASSEDNGSFLAGVLRESGTEVWRFPYLGAGASAAERVRGNAGRVSRLCDEVLGALLKGL